MKTPLTNPLFFIPVITGIIFLIVGIIMLKFPPRNINSYYGYRTKRSMRNKERWTFAQKYSAIQLIKLGGLLALSGFTVFFINPSEKTAMFIGLGLMLVMVVVLFLRVECTIKRKFYNEK